MAVPLGIIGQCFSEVWGDRDKILLIERLKTRLLQWGYTAHHVPMLFYGFDQDEDGVLNYTEFINMVRNLKLGINEARAHQLFNMMDGDGGGTIDDAEFVRILFPLDYHRIFDEHGHPVMEDDSSNEMTASEKTAKTASIKTASINESEPLSTIYLNDEAANI
jgi:hypothetical protein